MGRVNSESPMRVNAFSYSTAECIVMRYGICELSYPSCSGDNDWDPCASKRHTPVLLEEIYPLALIFIVTLGL